MIGLVSSQHAKGAHRKMGLLRMTRQLVLLTSLFIAATATAQEPPPVRVEYYIVPAPYYGGTVYQKLPPGHIPVECLKVTEHGSRTFTPTNEGQDQDDENEYTDSDTPLRRSPRSDIFLDEILAHQGEGHRVKYNDVPPMVLPDSRLPSLRQKQFGRMQEILGQIRNYSESEKSEYRPGYQLCSFKLWAFGPKVFSGSETHATKPNLRSQQ